MTLHGIQGHVAYPTRPGTRSTTWRTSSARNSQPLDEGNRHFPQQLSDGQCPQRHRRDPRWIPGELRCRFNFRYSTEWTKQALVEHIESLARDLDIDCDIDWRDVGRPFLTADGRLTRAVAQAVREQTGCEPELSTSGGTSDGRYISPYGVDVVEFGPGNRTIHKIDEEVLVDDLPVLEKTYYRIAELLLMEPADPSGKRSGRAD